MRCLTPTETSRWLAERGLIGEPYYDKSPDSPTFYLQFHTPKTEDGIESLVRSYFGIIIPDQETLIEMNDWASYLPEQMEVVTAIRSQHGEDRWLIHAPGHLISAEDVEWGIRLFSTSVAFGWSSHVYAPVAGTTLFNWEGDLFDFFTESEELWLGMKDLVIGSGLEIT